MGTELFTRWGRDQDPDHVLQEYPRPELARDSYYNLNGYWDYAITKSKTQPAAYDGQILVPFSPEAPLSGVKRQLKLTPDYDHGKVRVKVLTNEPAKKMPVRARRAGKKPVFGAKADRRAGKE